MRLPYNSCVFTVSVEQFLINMNRFLVFEEKKKIWNYEVVLVILVFNPFYFSNQTNYQVFVFS